MRRFFSIFSYVWAGLWLNAFLVLLGFQFPSLQAPNFAAVFGVPAAVSLGLGLLLDTAKPRRIAAGHTLLWTTLLSTSGLFSIASVVRTPEFQQAIEAQGSPMPVVDIMPALWFALPLIGLAGWMLVSGYRLRRASKPTAA